MSENEPTTGELARRFDRLDSNIETGFRKIDERLDRMVSTDVFNLNQVTMNARLETLTAKDVALEQKIERVEERRTTDRRLLVPLGGSALIAAIGWVITALQGAPTP